MTDTTKYLDALVRETHKTEAEIEARAFQTGLRQLWREQMLGRYLRGEITRTKTVELAELTGLNWPNTSIKQ